jgi:hypothetical protein
MKGITQNCPDFTYNMGPIYCELEPRLRQNGKAKQIGQLQIAHLFTKNGLNKNEQKLKLSAKQFLVVVLSLLVKSLLFNTSF